MFRALFWVILLCKMIVDRVSEVEAVRTSETSVDNHFTWQYNPEDSSDHHTRRRENLKSHINFFVHNTTIKTFVLQMWT
jgi:hypothetical protein